MKRILKKTVKFLLIALLVLFILIVTVPLLFKAQIKTKLIAEIDKNINATVNFNDLSFSSLKHFPHFTASLENVSIVGVGDFKNDTLAYAKEISVSISLFSILKGGLRDKPYFA